MTMNKNKNKKMVYVSPTLENTRLIFEGNIAVQSPVQKVDLKNWDYESPVDDVHNNADVWLNM